MVETQDTISAWATDTFGKPGSAALIAARSNVEMAELLLALQLWTVGGLGKEKVINEIADVIIVLSQLATHLGANMADAVDEKMLVNRYRKWATDGNGVGQHIQEGG